MNLQKLIDKHSVKILYAATLGGTALSFFGSVLNSKLLSKELFGDWKYLQSFIALVAYIVNFGMYSSAGRLIAATNDKTKVRIYKGYVIMFSVGGAIVIALTTLTIGFFFPKLLNETLFHLAIFLIPFFLIHPLGFYFETSYQGERKLIGLIIYRLLPPLLYVSSLYIFQSFSEGSIYYNALLFYITYFIICIALVYHDKPIFKGRSNEWKDLAAQHKSFGIHLYWGALWNLGAIYLLPLLVGLFNINNVEVGYYTLALSFIMPLSMLPSIVSTSNFKKYITSPTIPNRDFKKVIIACIVMEVGLLLTIDFFIDFFLTSKYQEVSYLIKIGSFGAILHGFADFVNKFLLAKGESQYMKKVSIAVGIIQIVSSLVLIKLYSATGGIIAKSIGSLALFLFLYIYYHKKYVIQKSEGHKIKIHEDEAAPIPDATLE